MIYPATFESKTGFDAVRRRLQELCLGQAGRQMAETSRISTKTNVINTWLAQTEEYVILLGNSGDLLAGPYPELALMAKRLEIEGAYLLEEELHHMRRLLHSFEQIGKFNKSAGRLAYPALSAIAAPVQGLGVPLTRINQVLDEDGRLRDSASTELQRIRRAIGEEQRHLRRRLEAILRQALDSGMAPEGAEITIRGGRLVIPIISEYKRRFKGFIHDESSTGQTVFMEPTDVLEANNAVRELEYDERREIQRILLDVTDVLRLHAPAIEAGYQTVALLDFIRAKARYAQAYGCTRPTVERGGPIALIQARNPVLQDILTSQGKALVPLTIRLDGEKRILVVSGPNAGGKSVALKTCALVQYMAQFGLLVPVAEGSTTVAFERFFIDIGDDQSLENDLSTYSSHLAHMRVFLEQANARSIVFIDEFGTGTDPAYGGPIATAVLAELNRKGVYGLITTHYSGLKDMAGATAGLGNGSMRFDVAHLAPLYELQQGKPGSSFALEIAQKSGLPAPVIAAARKGVGAAQADVDKLLVELERERTQLDAAQRRMAAAERITAKLQAEYEQAKAYLEQNRAQLVKQAKLEAQQLVAGANARIEQTIRDIREAEADKELTKGLRAELATLADEITLSDQELAVDVPEKGKKTAGLRKAQAAHKPVPLEVLQGPIAEGDAVRLRGQTVVGQVLAIKGNQVRVQMGSFESTLKLPQLEKVNRSALAQPDTETSLRVAGGLDRTQKMADFSSTLDVRGLYPQEALAQVEQLVDDALLLGIPDVRIIHGNGNGVLKNQIRTQLKAYPQVATLTYEHPDRGGEGVSLVGFR